MKQQKSFLMLIGIAAALIFGAIFSNMATIERAVEAQNGAARQWETMVMRGGNSPEDLYGALEKRGAQGWELVTVLQSRDGNFVAYLKRRK